MSDQGSQTVKPIARTGIEGLDDVLHGGLTPGRLYLVEGAPGSGKTALALQFPMLGGGIERGTSTLVMGAAGTGKSTLVAQFVANAAERGQKSVLFLFDEGIHTLISRCDGLNIPIRQHVEAGMISLQQVDPAEMSPGEFVHRIRHAVDVDGATIVVIDSLNGYRNAMPDERFLIVQLHEQLTYLRDAGVATLLLSAHHGLIGGHLASPVDASYLADAVVLMRHFEARGEIRQAISVVKKRGGAHERSIREFSMRDGGVAVGAPLREFRGILTGAPQFEVSETRSTGRNSS